MIILFSRDSLTWFIDFFFYLQYFHMICISHVICFHDSVFTLFIYFHVISRQDSFISSGSFSPHTSSHVFPIRLIYFHMWIFTWFLYFLHCRLCTWCDVYLSAHVQFQDIQCTLQFAHICTHYSLINHMREKKTHDLIWNVWFFHNRRSHGPAQFQICFVLSTPDPAVVLIWYPS